MDIMWRRITKTVYQLDGIWTVVCEPPGQWRAYRGNDAMLAGFADIDLAMKEAERLRTADRESAL